MALLPVPSGGYDYEFVDTPHDRYLCKICIHPCRDPHLSTCCGHNFCKSCLNDVKRTTRACPCCRDKQFFTVINKQADREIREFCVVCTNKGRGCEWKGELNDIRNHLENSDGCQFEDVTCSNKCGILLQRQCLTGHVETECLFRKVDCWYCHITGEFKFIDGKHKDQCPKFPVPCPNKCEIGSILRADQEVHRKECPLEIVQCSNLCGETLERQSLATHVKRKCPRRKVDCQYCHIIGEQQFIVDKHKEHCPKFPVTCPNKCGAENILRENMNAHRKECALEDVPCSNICGEIIKRKNLTSHMELECPCRKVDCQYCHITEEHQFIETEHKELCPKFPLSCPNKCKIESIPRQDMEVHRKECPLEIVQCEYYNAGCEEVIMRKDLVNHNEKNIKQHLSLTNSKLSNTIQQMADTQEELSSIKDQLSGTKAQLDDTLKQIKRLMILMNQTATTSKRPFYTTDVNLRACWSVLLATTAITTSDDHICPIILKFPEFSEKMKNEASMFTKSFYSHDRGYNMCLRIDPAGNNDGKGTHLSVYMYLMKGCYDDELTWPLRGTFEFKLLNQISDHGHHVQTLTYDEGDSDNVTNQVTEGKMAKSGLGYPTFISNENLHRVTGMCQYLKDDCIFLQVSKM